MLIKIHVKIKNKVPGCARVPSPAKQKKIFWGAISMLLLNLSQLKIMFWSFRCGFHSCSWAFGWWD